MFQQKFLQKSALAAFVDAVKFLADALDGRALRRHFHTHRIRAQDCRGQFRDIVGHGRAEEQVLSHLREQRHHLADIVDEPHIEHAVGFVEHKEFQRLQGNGLLADQVEQAPRSRHQDIDATNQVALLRSVTHTAKDTRRRNRGKLCVLLKAIFHLDGELARRQKNQRTARLGRAKLPGIEQALQNRERECGRLPRTRLGDTQKVLAFQEARDGLFLNGGGLFVTNGADCTLEGIGQGKF